MACHFAVTVYVTLLRLLHRVGGTGLLDLRIRYDVCAELHCNVLLLVIDPVLTQMSMFHRKQRQAVVIGQCAIALYFCFRWWKLRRQWRPWNIAFSLWIQYTSLLPSSSASSSLIPSGIIHAGPVDV